MPQRPVSTEWKRQRKRLWLQAHRERLRLQRLQELHEEYEQEPSVRIIGPPQQNYDQSTQNPLNTAQIVPRRPPLTWSLPPLPIRLPHISTGPTLSAQNGSPALAGEAAPEVGHSNRSVTESAQRIETGEQPRPALATVDSETPQREEQVWDEPTGSTTPTDGDAVVADTVNETCSIPDISELTLEDDLFYHISSPIRQADDASDDASLTGEHNPICSPSPSVDYQSPPAFATENGSNLEQLADEIPTRLNSDSAGSVLDTYIQELSKYRNGANREFINSQSAVYDKLFKEFFSLECDCSNPAETNEPESAHTLQESVQFLQSHMPSLATIFGETSSYDPSSFFAQWYKFLDDGPNKPLSFSKTQRAVHNRVLKISRRWDIDSIWIGAQSLGALKSPNDFCLSFLPCAALNHSTDQVIQPHGLDIAKTRHIHLGTFNISSVRFAVFVLLPKADQGPNSRTSSSKNALSLQRQEDFYDKIILPALYETIPEPFRQEIPQSYAMLYAKSRSYQEKIGNNRWKPDDDTRAAPLRYIIPAEHLTHFWGSVVEKSNELRIVTARGAEVAYFESPQLLFQSHDLKNTFCRSTLQDTLTYFAETVLAGFNISHIDIFSCWIDIGCRDHAASPTAKHSRSDPYTILWKSQCNRKQHQRLCAIVPDCPLTPTYFTSFLLRDACTYKTNAKRSKASNPGHPASRNPGIIRAKAYDSIKEEFAVMYSSYRIFGSGFLSLAAFTDDMIQELWSTSRRHLSPNTSQIKRQSLIRAWEANKRHLRAISEAKILPSYGSRKEVTFCLGPILRMLRQGHFRPELNPDVGKIEQRVSFSTDSGRHCPFWVVPTKDIKALILAQAARLILPLDYLFQQPSISPPRDYNLEDTVETSVRFVLAYYFAQLLCRLLIFSLSTEQELPFDNWIWKTKWKVRGRQSNRMKGVLLERRGLGLSEAINAKGMLWFPPGSIDWEAGHIALEVLSEIYIPRSPLHPRIAALTNIRLLTTTKATSELYLQNWLHQATRALERGNNAEAGDLAVKIVRLAAEEIARSYHRHMYIKLAGAWDRLRANMGQRKLPRLKRLQQGQELTREQKCKILNAQTIREIYIEAWNEYCRSQSATSPIQIPNQLPRWMVTRKFSRFKNGWSSFIFDRLFDRPEPPSWDRVQFRELYRSFKEMWNIVYSCADSFDTRFRRIIGNYIMVAFNSDKSKEIGTNHGSGTWYEDQPTFFQIQFWAPYFSPPKQHLGARWELITARPLSYNIPHDATSNELTAIEFQDENDAFETLWFETLSQPERLEDMSPDEKSEVCLQAIRHLMTLAGPKWEGERGLPYVIPWTFPNQPAQSDCHESDIFRVPLPLSSVKAAHRDAVLSRPTVILPTFHNITSFTAHISSQSRLSSEVTNYVAWIGKTIGANKQLFEIPSHLEAKYTATQLIGQPPSLLQSFLSQIEPPQREISGETQSDAESDELDTEQG